MEPVSFFSAFLMGLLASTHCVAMCGGIACLIQTQTEPHVLRTPLQNSAYALMTNSGRISCYMVLGILAGALGSLAHLLPDYLPIAEILRIFAGTLLILVAIQLAGQAQVTLLDKLGKPIWRYAEPLARKLLPIKSPARAYVWGLLWGLLPCGMVYTLLMLAASTQHPISAGLVMLSFGLGTLPALFITGLSAITFISWLKQRTTRWILAALLLAMGLWLAASPWVPGLFTAHHHMHG